MNTRTRVAQAKVGIEIAQAEAEQTRIELANKYNDLLLDIQLAEQQLNSAQSALVSSENLWEIAQKKYAENLINFTELTDVQTNLFRAKSEVLQAQFQCYFQKIILEAMVGG